MKKYLIVLTVLAYILIGCHSGHNHGADKNEIHTHEGHNHAEHDHSGHSHSTAGESGEHTDEIVFTREQAEAIGLETETVSLRPFRQVIKTSGQIQSPQNDEIVISATADGIVTFANPNFTEGIAVTQGQSIVTISARNLPEGDQATRIRIEYENAESEYYRAENLVQDQIISTREFEQIRTRYETARTAYQAQAANVTSGGIRVNTPIAGYLKNTLVSQGEYVTVGQPIATIARSKHLQLRAEVSERYYKQLSSVTGANFRPGYDPTVYRLSDLNGKLLSYGKTAGNESFYLPVTFEFDNKGDLLNGSFVEVWLLGRQQQNILSIPLAALTEEQGLYFVFLQTGNEEYKKQEVTIGSDDGERIEILAGLTPGETIVTKGTIQVKLAANAGLIPEGHTH